jgi:hypothetical protein
VVEEIVVDLNTNADVNIIVGNYAPLILAPAEDLLTTHPYNSSAMAGSFYM